MEAVKPLLAKHGLTLTVSDEIVMIGERYYVKSTAVLTDTETGQTDSCTAFAREEESKKGMDSSQLTGATSSYARKYCLNGLFCIDDNKDADTESYAKQTGKDKKEEKPKNTGTWGEIAKPAAPAIACDCCGKIIEPVQTRSGKTYEVSTLVDHSQADFGKNLCFACYKAESKKKKEDESNA